jgi:hypothetical protein
MLRAAGFDILQQLRTDPHTCTGVLTRKSFFLPNEPLFFFSRGYRGGIRTRGSWGLSGKISFLYAYVCGF